MNFFKFISQKTVIFTLSGLMFLTAANANVILENQTGRDLSVRLKAKNSHGEKFSFKQILRQGINNVSVPEDSKVIKIRVDAMNILNQSEILRSDFKNLLKTDLVFSALAKKSEALKAYKSTIRPTLLAGRGITTGKLESKAGLPSAIYIIRIAENKNEAGHLFEIIPG